MILLKSQIFIMFAKMLLDSMVVFITYLFDIYFLFIHYP